MAMPAKRRKFYRTGDHVRVLVFQRPPLSQLSAFRVTELVSVFVAFPVHDTHRQLT